MKYCSDFKRNGILIYAATWMTLNEITQAQKYKCYTNLFELSRIV